MSGYGLFLSIFLHIQKFNLPDQSCHFIFHFFNLISQISNLWLSLTNLWISKSTLEFRSFQRVKFKNIVFTSTEGPCLMRLLGLGKICISQKPHEVNIWLMQFWPICFITAIWLMRFLGYLFHDCNFCAKNWQKIAVIK